MDTPKPSPAPGVVQTTIDSSTTTVDPTKVTVHNRVEPGTAAAAFDAAAEKTPTTKVGDATLAAVPMHPADPKA
jgi:hypothetical protein